MSESSLPMPLSPDTKLNWFTDLLLDPLAFVLVGTTLIFVTSGILLALGIWISTLF